MVLASLLAGFGLLTHLAPSVGAAARSLNLYGTAAGGWSFTAGTETNPGPTITANVGDNLTVHMISEDGADHGVFIDLNDDGHIEPASDVSSPTGTDVTFSFIVPASPGSHYYYCSIHSPSAQGHYAPGAPMYGVFRVNANPSAAFVAPVLTTSWTGGTAHNVTFTLSDEDPPTSLTVWLNYSYAAGTQRGTIAGPIAGTANPNTVPWTPPSFSATDVRIAVTARDTQGGEGTTLSDAFEVDSTPPLIQGRLPASNAVNVPRNARVQVTWSEGMAESASGAANTFALQRVSDGAWTAGTVTWSADATQMTFAAGVLLDATTAYRVLVNATARDGSDPGNPFATTDSWQFTTGSIADRTPPTIQTVAASPTTQVAGADVSIGADVTDDIGVASVSARVVGPSFDANLTMVSDGGVAWYANRSYATPGSYSVVVWAIDGTGNAASRSAAFSISPPPIPAPTGVVVHVLGDGTIHVIWSPVAGGTIAGYNVYRGLSENGPFTKLTATPVSSSGPLFYVDREAQPGVTYYYVVTAVDVGGNESPQSTPASGGLPGTAPSQPVDYTLPILAAAGLGVAAVAVAAVVWRRKKKSA